MGNERWRWARAAVRGSLLLALAGSLTGCSPTVDEIERFEAELRALPGVERADFNSTVPFDETVDDLMPLNVVSLRIYVEPELAPDAAGEVLLTATERLWRDPDFQPDIDELGAFIVRSSSGERPEVSLTLATAVLESERPAARSVLQRARGLELDDGLSASWLSACEAWATFGDRTSTPYRSHSGYAVDGCGSQEYVVRADGDLPPPPITVWLYDHGTVLYLFSLFVVLPALLVMGHRRRRARFLAKLPPPVASDRRA